jgi:phage tail sheath protein FI
MAEIYKSPGVYRQQVFLNPPPVLQTGVPGFVGFAGSLPDGSSMINQPVALNRKEEFSAQFNSMAGSYFADVVASFFDNRGVRCYAVAADSTTNPVQGLLNAVAALAPLDDMDLVAVPDAATLQTPDKLPDTESILHVQSEVLKHCADQGDRFAILDSWPGAGVDDVINQCRQLTVGMQEPLNGALYYPWLVPTTGGRMPPCGHVAGIYARSDIKTGVFKAPANEEILGVLDLESQIDNNIQDKLNPERVNCLRAFPGRGIRVWGARTLGRSLAGDDGSAVPEWLYVNVRRLFLTVRRWIDLQMGWAAFEPNNFHLWVRIVRELTAFLTRLQRDGALQGTKPDESFYVKCDAENNPPELRELGQVIIEIGLAPLAPGEFIVVRIVRSAGGASQD